MSGSRGRQRREGGGSRLLEKPPRVYVGPGASAALGGVWGLLLGAKRPQWIDVLELSPRPASRWSQLAACRLESSPSWTIVGVSLPEAELERHGRRLLGKLVPGDVVVTERGARVHLGDTWAAAKMLRDAKARR